MWVGAMEPCCSPFLSDTLTCEVLFLNSRTSSNVLAKGSVARLADRCAAIEGDALTSVPAGADAYILKGVTHGRSDAEAVDIYRNCRSAMPAHAKLLVIERVLPERIDPDDPRCRANVLTDMNMMLMSPGGRERTEVEHRQLLMQAGLQIERVVPTPSLLAIIQATPAPHMPAIAVAPSARP
jgi:hypothetical protein